MRRKPSFSSGDVSTEVLLENEKRPLVLESSDLDVGLNALITYSIIEDVEMRKVNDNFLLGQNFKSNFHLYQCEVFKCNTRISIQF